MSFKPTAKILAEAALHQAHPTAAVTEIIRHKLSPIESKHLGVPSGTHVVEAFADGQLVGYAKSLDWRKAYKLLAEQLSK